MEMLSAGMEMSPFVCYNKSNLFRGDADEKQIGIGPLLMPMPLPFYAGRLQKEGG
jgi:hypothetical protein